MEFKAENGLGEEDGVSVATFQRLFYYVEVKWKVLPASEKIEKTTQWMIDLANNPNAGYDQTNRC